MIAIALAACVEPEGPPFLTLRGAIDPDVVVEGDDAQALLAWVTAVDGELCFETVEVPFSPYLLQYEVAIEGPPPLDSRTCVVAPEGFTGVRAALSALVLADPSPRADVTLDADPSALLGWFAGEPEEISSLFVASGGKIVALATRFALITSAGESPSGDRWCRLGGMLDGLAPYIDRGTSCDGWEAIAEPGVHTEVQGIDLDPP